MCNKLWDSDTANELTNIPLYIPVMYATERHSENSHRDCACNQTSCHSLQSTVKKATAIF